MIPMQRTRRAVDRRSAVHGLFLAMTCLLLPAVATGCFTKNFDDIQTGIETRGHYITHVPFVRQGEDDCGPASLASVFAYWKRPVDLAEIVSQVYLPKLRGSLPMDMEHYAKASGFLTATPPGNIDVLRAELRMDRPVICLLDLGYGFYRQPHYITAIGFDDGNGLIIMHDGRKANATLSYESFERAWARAGHWMLVVTPKKSE